ncbi:MAG: hypothetical protein HQL53_13450, partial [Magnetococcales bacterium]|nr:hypothetical protein [Magnetococcales bacterium]
NLPAQSLKRVGCNSEKLLLTRHFHDAESVDEARRLLRSKPGAHHGVVLQNVPEALKRRMRNPTPQQPGQPNRIRVASFSYTHLALDLKINNPHPMWLLYRDGYHPDWRATANGQPIPVIQADIGFKAVLVEPGSSHIRFELDRGLMGHLGTLILISGMSMGVAWILWMLFSLFRPVRSGTVQKPPTLLEAVE